MNQIKTICLAALLALSMGMTAQDLVISYEVQNGLNGQNSLRVYMQSTTPDPVAVGAVNFSFAHVGNCLDFQPVSSVFKNAWTDFLEKEVDKTQINRSYQGKAYDNRVQYGIAEPGMPNTDMVTIPASDQAKLLVLEMRFNGACGNAIYMEDQSENPLNQIGCDNFRTVPYVIERETAPTAPVQWLSFNAIAIDRYSAELTWETKAETGSDYFEIEKSFDRNMFQTATLDRVKGAGTTTENRSYLHLDETEMAAVVYYRLKHVDFSGAFTYSNVVEVNFDDTAELELGLSIYPNPISDFATLTIKGLENDELRVQVTDLKGAIIMTQPTTLDEKGKQEVSINLEGLANGIYNVHVFSAVATTKGNTLQVVKQ